MSIWLIIGIVFGAGFILAGVGLAWRQFHKTEDDDGP